LQQTPTRSNLPPTGYRQLTPIASTPRHMSWCHGGTMLKCQRWLCWGLVCTICCLHV